jgi:hypothetical protein
MFLDYAPRFCAIIEIHEAVSIGTLATCKWFQIMASMTPSDRRSPIGYL